MPASPAWPHVSFLRLEQTPHPISYSATTHKGLDVGGANLKALIRHSDTCLITAQRHDLPEVPKQEIEG